MPPTNLVKILYAEDDIDDRFFVSKALNEITIANELVIFNDGQQLIEYLNIINADLPDIILLDVSMPRKTGIECLFEIRENTLFKNMKIIMVTTSYKLDIIYENKLIGSLLSIGAQGYLRKKSNFEEFKKDIHDELIRVTENLETKNHLN